MNKRISLILLSLCLAMTAIRAQVSVPRWPEDKTIERSADYEVSVRTANGDWQPLDVLSCQVNLASRSKASFAEFDMGEPVEVRVVNNKRYSSVLVRPQSNGIKVQQVDSHTVEFTLQQPKYLSIEYDGDQAHNLHLFANPLFSEKPDLSEKAITWQGENAQDVFV